MRPEDQPLKEVPWDSPQRGEVIACDDTDPEEETDNLT